MKLTYWFSPCTEDADCYSVRERTKREALKVIAALPHQNYAPPIKVVLEYASGFELLQRCLCEGRLGYEEEIARRTAEQGLPINTLT